MSVRIFLYRFLGIVSFCFLIACSSPAAEKAERVEKAESRNEQISALFNPEKARHQQHQLDSLFRVLHKKRGFNGTVLVTQFNKVIYKGAFGYSNFIKKDTLTTANPFQLASVSKQFTAMAIMMLAEDGKLQYHDEVQRFFPDFPYECITIWQLLTHRSGLPNYTYFTEKHWPNRRKLINNEEVISLLTQHKPKPYYRPNIRFDYSNTGYCLLAAIVVKASGQPFETFMKERIFDPLDMKQTWVLTSSNTENLPWGHTRRRQKRDIDFLDGVQGDKGIYSTVEDLYKWDQALYTEKLVSQTTLTAAFTGAQKRKTKEDYGYGWRLRNIPSGDSVEYHGGLWHGFNTYIMRNRRDHSAIIVLSNVPNGSLMYISEVQNILYTQPALLAQNKKKPI